MFDPLHKWLGIPADQQPPDHYRLLGVARFEEDPEVIDAAADRHLSFLHHLTNGEHAALAEELSNQISAARLCLVSAQKKRAYDDSLRRRSAAGDPGPTDTGNAVDAVLINPRGRDVAPVVQAPMVPAPMVPASNPVTAVPRVAKRRSSRKTGSSLTYWHYSILLSLITLAMVGIGIKRGFLAWDSSRLAMSPTPAEAEAEATTGEAAAGRPPTAPAQPITSEVSSNAISSAAGGMSVDEVAAPSVDADSPMDGTMDDANVEPPSAPEVSSAPPPPPAVKTGDSLVDLVHSSRAPTNKDPLPTGQPLAEKMTLVSELYQEQYRGAKTSADKVALAEQMHGDGVATQDDTVGRFSLWRVARGIFAGQGRFESALEVVDDLGAHYEGIDVQQWKAESLTDSIEGVSGTRVAVFVDAVLGVMDQCREEEKFQLAAKLGTFTHDKLASRMTRSKLQQLTVMQQAVQFEGGKYLGYQAALRTLEQSPGEPQAHQLAGEYLCLVAQRWSEGLKHLAAGPPSELQAAASTELAAPQNADGAIAVADAWYGIAPAISDSPARDAVLRHALRGYAAAQGVTSGLVRKKVDLRIEELETSYPERLPDDGAAVSSMSGASSSAAASSGDSGDGPAVLDRKSRNGGDSRRDFASCQDNILIVGMGGRPDGTGQAEAGIELSGVKKITVTGSASHDQMVTVDAYSKSGFVIDYHTPAGYVRRVFLGLELQPAREFLPLPVWGKASVPDEVTDIGRAPSYQIDLTRWAPSDWDGRCWFSMLMHNAGPDRKLEATLSW